MAKATVAFSLDPERDRDVLAWLDKQANRSAAIREAIRASLGARVTLGDVYREVVEVKRMLRSGAVAVQANEPQGDDPAVARIEAQLANLGL